MHEIDSPSWFNPVEGSKIVDLIEGLLNSSTVDVSADDIGVIAFYRQQVLKIRLMLRERNLSQVRVGGVNDYQGQEARIIFISTVGSRGRPDRYVYN
jgi:helicase MOV-10